MFHITKTIFCFILAVGFTACTGISNKADDKREASPSAPITSTASSSSPETLEFSKLAKLFDFASIIGEPKLVDCRLSGGTTTQCISVTLRPKPASFKIGPWCPRNISEGPDASGIWLHNGKIYDSDGEFIQNLAKFYNDPVWQMFDPVTGKINVTDTERSCRAAARPDVDPQYQNHCVECQV